MRPNSLASLDAVLHSPSGFPPVNIERYLGIFEFNADLIASIEFPAANQIAMSLKILMSAARFAEPVTKVGIFVDLVDDVFLVEILPTLDEKERTTFVFGGMFL